MGTYCLGDEISAAAPRSSQRPGLVGSAGSGAVTDYPSASPLGPKSGDVKLSVRSLRKSYGSVIALGDTSVDMAEGEFLTLLGPSGSGKTTLLMAIAGLNLPDSGEVWIDGKLATYLPPSRRDIGMVFQNYALFPHMTVAENIAFPLRMRKTPEAVIRGEVARSLEMIQLPHVADRLPRQLSGGQQQRIALARCMVYQPSIILMDEPLGALDKKLRDRMQLEIKRLHTELGITILYVTHDQEEALVMSDRICLMNEGRIEQIGTPQDLYFRPKTVFAADFLGESNLLRGTLRFSSATAEVDVPGVGILRGVPPQHLVDAFVMGAAVTLMVRPESVRVLASGESADNVVEVNLRDRVLVGQVTRLYAHLADGTEIVATSLTSLDTIAPEPGQRLRFGWSAGNTVALLDGREAR